MLRGDSAIFSLSRGRAARQPVLRRRRGDLAARHHALRLPGHLAAREPGGPALGLARLPLDDRQRRADRALGERQPAPSTTSAICSSQAGRQRVSGELVAITDRRRGLGVRDMRLQLRDLDLDAVRAYLDTLPFYGTLTGSVSGLRVPRRARRAARLGLRRRAGAGQSGQHHRRRGRRRRPAGRRAWSSPASRSAAPTSTCAPSG